jgi:hypothetical protein
MLSKNDDGSFLPAQVASRCSFSRFFGCSLHAYIASFVRDLSFLSPPGIIIGGMMRTAQSWFFSSHGSATRKISQPVLVLPCRLLFRLNLVFPTRLRILLLTLVLMPALAPNASSVQCPYLPPLHCHCQRHILNPHAFLSQVAHHLDGLHGPPHYEQQGYQGQQR